MKVVALLHTWSTGALLAATATTLVQPVGASSSSSDECSTLWTACNQDATCPSCSNTYTAEYDTCADSISVAGLESSTEYCSVLTERVCCLVSVSYLDCLESDLFMETWLCVLESNGCLVDELPCAADESVSSDSRGEESSSDESAESSSSDSEESLIGASSGAGSAGVGHPSTTVAALSCVFVVLLSLVRV